MSTDRNASGRNRAAMLIDFDRLPDGALIDIPTWAAVQDCGESTAWRRALTDPDHPDLIRLSKRCTRVRVGDGRAYLRKKGAA